MSESNISPDGNYRFEGGQWVPNTPPPAPKQKISPLKGCLISVLVVIVGAVGCSALTGGGGDTASDTPTAAAPTETEASTPEATEDEATEEPTEEAVPEETITKSQEQALRKAEEYLSFQAFSKAGLVNQLTSEIEGFDEADAKWAVAQLDVDWKEQAAKKAEEYLEFQAFSRSGLINQLTSEIEGFTEAQAEYAADKVGL